LGFTGYQLLLLKNQLSLLQGNASDTHDQLGLLKDQLGLLENQLGLLKDSYVNAHDWNRRKAAQDAIATTQFVAEDTPLLNEKFEVLTSADTRPLEDVRRECNDNVKVRLALHRRLNLLETFAVGVNQAVLDEDVIKAAYSGLFARTLNQFKEYIVHRRNTGIQHAWVEFERLAKKWEEEAQPTARPKTGEPKGNT
jgi:hypothetical protein